jgi:hypothetical protein
MTAGPTARLRRAAAAAAVVAGLALLAPAAALADDGCPGADTVVAARDPRALTGPTLCLINAERAAAGLEAVAERPALMGAAAAFSAQMVGRSFFAHRAPDGPDLVARLRRAGYLGPRTAVWVVGENLAWARGTAATPRGIVAAWLASPAHRANILERDFRDIGTGVVAGTPGDPGDGVTVTTDFGRAIASQSRRRPRRPRGGVRHRWPAPGWRAPGLPPITPRTP